ncbi:CHAP domain-containing protein [Streptomyces sp. NPDC002033]|uniref:CHAP domain-containing protein n=1 Tax=unclassified Streptomyces TaxID=2593676 RepID=UPI0033166672
MPSARKTTALRAASTSALAASALTVVLSGPAHASALTDGIAATARAEAGNGACAHGGYLGGPNQNSSCSGGQRTHAWCADFAGWVWARNGVTGLSALNDLADSFYGYGVKYGTLSSTPHVGDAVVYNHGGGTGDDHVAIVTAISGGTVTITGGNQGGYPGRVSTNSTTDWRVGAAPWGQTISGYVSPAGTSTPSYPNPASLPAGTLVKSPNAADVKVMISGAGIPVAASDVAPDGYDLSRIVLVDDAAFRSLPGAPPAGTVVHDQAGGNSRFVIVDGAALGIGGADWTEAGYNARPDMGVPTAWLRAAGQRKIASGIVVMDQTGKDPSRYVMVDGAALPISGAEWTANEYDQQMLMGVPGQWLRGAVATSPGNGTVVKSSSGADATVYVMAGGKAVPLSYEDFTGLGYDRRTLEAAPGAWLSGAAARTAPADGTMLLPRGGDGTVWQVTAGGRKRAMAATEFGPGKLSFDDVVAVPAALVNALPTA